ncbi:hypothetical protein BDW02DRAFT_627104 [Decorospora gaudefroyi]|uniref:Uncharacterized protein n=1 Tax=Decorospora gaudefroyi TaxID=184978 RepID=A0A6A5KTI5_9PLEO|nr:hypothetical protein BDW02DRAFT_627104 [Decorospora gaudefroyi]
MFVRIPISLLLLLPLSTTTYAAPTRTRTQCRCSYVPNAPPPSPPIDTPSAAHWAPPITYPSSTPPVSVGAQTCSEQYATSVVVSSSASEAGRGQRTASSSDGRILACSWEVEERKETVRIVNLNRSLDENVWFLQLVILVSVVAFVAEGVHWGVRWLQQRREQQRQQQQQQQQQQQPVSEKTRLRLSGAEKLLLAVPPMGSSTNPIASPGVDKKLRAYRYEATRYFVTQGASGRREFIAYEEDSDDESNRPVM